MNWYEILGLVLGSSAVTTVVNALVSRKQTNANIYEVFTERLEKRIQTLEKRIDRLETRDSIFSSATSCAYSCRHSEECPVINFIANNPLPGKSMDTTDMGTFEQT